MTDQERATLERLADAWNAFCALPIYHPSDADEFMRAIHAAQHIIMARVAVRAEPAFFTAVDA